MADAFRDAVDLGFFAGGLAGRRVVVGLFGAAAVGLDFFAGLFLAVVFLGVVFFGVLTA